MKAFPEGVSDLIAPLIAFSFKIGCYLLCYTYLWFYYCWTYVFM